MLLRGLEHVAGAAVAHYIEYERDRWHGLGKPLQESQKNRFSAYFGEEDLERVRIIENQRLPIPRPPEYRHLLRWTGWSLPDPDGVAAITFDSVVISRDTIWDSLLFHEMVHVAQFRLLGVRRFSQEYVRGFFVSKSYTGISLEACAFELESRFLRGLETFQVESEIEKWLEKTA